MTKNEIYQLRNAVSNFILSAEKHGNHELANRYKPVFIKLSNLTPEDISTTKIPDGAKAIAIVSQDNRICAAIIPEDDPYIDLTLHKEKKVINLRVKLEDEGIVIDVFDESNGNYEPDPVLTTWVEYTEFGVPA